MFSWQKLLLYSLALNLIAACGFKGPLYMPKKAASSPAPLAKANKYAPSAPLAQPNNPAIVGNAYESQSHNF